MKMNRRKFLTTTGAVGALTFLPKAPVEAAVLPDSYATLIDLGKCDGCKGKDTVLCVESCRQGRKTSFPEPPREELQDYWPQKKHEDWSEKRGLRDRFTPYNWLFVQQVEIDGKIISIPRRCMHCDSPACAKLCPFGVNHKTAEGPVYIDQNLCFGGAKCRTVCPWSVPQRQAGVGIYTLWQKYLPVGGGVMFKCDLCRDRLADDKNPFCIDACPQQAMKIGRRDDIFQQAQLLNEEYGGDIYGMSENGGTSTIYVSPVPFDRIDQALVAQSKQKKKVVRLNQMENLLDKQKSWAFLSVISPFLGIMAAIGLSGKKVVPGDK
jgi:formate dehydrogenase iron-sulfur subunit